MEIHFGRIEPFPRSIKRPPFSCVLIPSACGWTFLRTNCLPEGELDVDGSSERERCSLGQLMRVTTPVIDNEDGSF